MYYKKLIMKLSLQMQAELLKFYIYAIIYEITNNQLDNSTYNLLSHILKVNVLYII